MYSYSYLSKPLVTNNIHIHIFPPLNILHCAGPQLQDKQMETEPPEFLQSCVHGEGFVYRGWEVINTMKPHQVGDEVDHSGRFGGTTFPCPRSC